MESADILTSKEIASGSTAFANIAILWKDVSDLFYEAGTTGKIEFIQKAAEILKAISEMERVTMLNLKEACTSSI